MLGSPFLSYANQGAIRNDPLSPQLSRALEQFLPGLGITAKVFSGGQEPTGPRRTGSTRHDHGNAADVFFYKDGRRLDWSNPQDLPVFQEIVKRGKAAGLTGFGAGPGYMQPGSMHIGFGNPGVWGAGGRGANAPEWLRSAYSGGTASPVSNSQVIPASAQAGSAKTKGEPMNRLLGNMGGMNPQMAQLLGIDPKAARWNAVGSMLKGLGVGLMTDDWSKALDTSTQSMQDFRNEAIMGQQMQMQMEDRQAKMAEQAQQQKERARQQAAFDQLLAGVPPERRALAEAFPNQFAQQYAQEMFPGPQIPADPKSYAPIPYDMGNGQIGYGIPMEDGSFRPVQTPEGAQFLSPYEKAYQTNAGATRGKTVTEQELSASSDIAAADQALDLIRQIERNPGIDWGTGFTSLGNIVPGTSGYDFQNLVEQTKSGAFLTAIDQLRGMGALSNMEGQAATAAITRINTATSKEAFLKALDDYRKIVEAARERAIRRGPQGQQQDPQAVPAPMAPQAGGMPDLSTLSDAELEALANGQ